MNPNFLNLISKFNPLTNEKLAKYTTWKVGGPAEALVIVSNSKELAELLQIAFENKVKVTILGEGANVLISDKGLDGLVIINKSKNIEILEEKISAEQTNKEIDHRHGEVEKENLYTFEDLDYEESGGRTKVKFDSGVSLTLSNAKLLKEGVTGLQFFAGIPSTIGGALYNNIHGGTKHFSDYFDSAAVFDLQTGKIFTADFDYFQFGYDQSILRDNPNLIVLDVTLNLFRGDVQKAKFVSQEWLKRKKIQPRTTAGCVFKNTTKEEQAKTNLPTPSVGYIIDSILNLKGKTKGGAKISEKHANFIENFDNASAKDILSLIDEIKQKTKEKLGIELQTEINFLGFDS